MQSVGSDAAVQKGVVRGNILITIGKSANSNAINLGASYDVRNEDKKSWTAHYEFMRESYGGDSYDTKVMRDTTDGDKGLIGAHDVVFRNARRFHCSQHHKSHVQRKGGAPAKAVYMTLVTARLLLTLQFL